MCVAFLSFNSLLVNFTIQTKFFLWCRGGPHKGPRAPADLYGRHWLCISRQLACWCTIVCVWWNSCLFRGHPIDSKASSLWTAPRVPPTCSSILHGLGAGTYSSSQARLALWLGYLSLAVTHPLTGHRLDAAQLCWSIKTGLQWCVMCRCVKYKTGCHEWLIDHSFILHTK